MINDILKAKGFSWLTYALMGIQLLLLLSITILLLSVMNPTLEMSTIISAVIAFMLGLPILLLLYTSGTDRIAKEILFGLFLNLSLLSLSGILWYIVADKLNMPSLVFLAKIIMVTCYVPVIYVLYNAAGSEHKKLCLYPKLLIILASIVCTLLILYYTIRLFDVDNALNISIYFISTLCDIVILGLASLLVIVYKPIQIRYLFTIIFIYILFSLAGDSLNLAAALSINVYNASVNAQIFYNAMLIFFTAAMLIYYIFWHPSTLIADVNRKLDDTRHAMDDLVRQMPDAACVYSPEGDVVTANEPFFKTFGVDREGIIGKFNLFDHLAPLQCEMSRMIPQLKKGETLVMERVAIQFKGGRQAYISFKLFPTFSLDGTVFGFIAICEDVTARVRADEELKHEKELGELYLDLMGHDINNMNQVGMGFLEIALDTLGLEDDKKALLLKPLEAMMNSSRLIDNVKKLRRANDGNMYLRPMDLNNLLEDVIAEHGQVPGRDVSISYCPCGDAIVMANELLKDVFANLLSNAIKHSRGAIHIDIRQDTIEANGKRCYRVTVEDDGPGIPEELKPAIFGHILRGHARVGGDGIGLYLVKTLVDKFGGSISVEDRAPGELNRGTRFIVMLPAV